MPQKHYFLRNAIIAGLLPAIVGGTTGPAGPALTEETLEAVSNYMARSVARRMEARVSRDYRQSG